MRNSKKDLEIAEENKKLKSEMDRLAIAVDQIMKEKGINLDYTRTSPAKIHKFQDEVEYLEELLKEKDHTIAQLEHDLKNFRSEGANKENRVVNAEDNLYKRSKPQAKNEQRVLEDRMMELDAIIHRIESTIYAFETKRTLHDEDTHRQFDTIESSYGTYPDALKNFCKRLQTSEKSLDKIISICLTKEKTESPCNKTLERSSPNKSFTCTDLALEREAEQFLSRAHQKYQDFFDQPDAEKKDCIFKELYNINHQLVKLLQKSEDRVEAEASKAQRNKRALDDVMIAIQQEDSKEVLQEIRSISQTLLAENDQLVREVIELRNDLSRAKQQDQDTDKLSCYKEQIDLLEKKNQLLTQKLKSMEGDLQNAHNILPLQTTATGIKQRFEETNASLERAFERICILESENNELMDSVNSAKSEKAKLQTEFDSRLQVFEKMQEQRRNLELEKSSIRETLRTNKEQMEDIKNEKKDIQRRMDQLAQEKKISS
ncbi:unnamed protein product [Moneuplotes crassus]|uniref:Uncharacterized protein n=1 Tax=Euplotes crassus TaxID=5936 RepID=A0AAD2D147_EUPCR|nr:unnamed protein product [Moneuplotes crassus]